MNQPKEDLRDSILQALGIKREDRLTNHEWEKVNKSLDVFVRSYNKNKIFSKNTKKETIKSRVKNSPERRTYSHPKIGQRSSSNSPFYKKSNSRHDENRGLTSPACSYAKLERNLERPLSLEAEELGEKLKPSSEKSLQSETEQPGDKLKSSSEGPLPSEIEQFEEKLKSSSDCSTLETIVGEELWLHDLGEPEAVKQSSTEKLGDHAWKNQANWEKFIDHIYEMTTLGDRAFNDLEKATTHAIQKMSNIGNVKAQDLTRDEQYRLVVIQRALQCLERKLVEEHNENFPKLFRTARRFQLIHEEETELFSSQLSDQGF